MPKTAETAPTAAPTFSRRELVPDDREAEREDGAAGALDDAGGDERADVQREGRAEQPTQEDAEAMTSSRSLPYWSPSFPSSGVATDAKSRKPVSSQVAQAVVVSNSSWSTGSAGTIIVCWSAKAMPAKTRIASVTL